MAKYGGDNDDGRQADSNDNERQRRGNSPLMMDLSCLWKEITLYEMDVHEQ